MEDFWNRALPSFLLFSVSCSRGLWKKTRTFYLENLCNLSCFEKKRRKKKKKKKTKSFLFKRLLSDCSDIYCNEVFWTYHFPPTHETHEAPFRPIAVCVQAQQKHRRRNTSHSFAHLEKNRFIYPNSLRRLFFCFQYHITTPHGKQNFETRR